MSPAEAKTAEASLNGHNEATLPLPTPTDTLRWQRKLLPFITRFIGALALLCFGLSVFDMVQASRFLTADHGGDIRTQLQTFMSDYSKNSEILLTPDQVSNQAVLMLEADALDKRYHQAGALLMSRIFTKHLAFLTGMVMSFLGSLFILGKISEQVSHITGGAANWKAGITSSSPGIILAFFGTVLIGISLVVQTGIEVRDTPVFLNSALRSNGDYSESAPALGEKAPPPPIDPKDLEDPVKPNRKAGNGKSH